MIGAMTMPVDFKYRTVFLRGRPKHQKYDDFWRRHPPMPPARWAKIFSPFDALDGFDEAILSKEVPYENRRDLSESRKEVLDHTLSLLHARIRDARARGTERPVVHVTCFHPCTDHHSEWYGKGGRYQTADGICREIDDLCRTMTVGESTIPIEDIIDITVHP